MWASAVPMGVAIQDHFPPEDPNPYPMSSTVCARAEEGEALGEKVLSGGALRARPPGTGDGLDNAGRREDTMGV